MASLDPALLNLLSLVVPHRFKTRWQCCYRQHNTVEPAAAGMASNENEFLYWLGPRALKERWDLAALQRGAQLISRLLQSVGPFAGPWLGTRSCAASLIGVTSFALARQPLPPAALQAVRAVCRALAASLTLGSDEAGYSVDNQQFGLREVADKWAGFTAQVRQVRRNLVQLPDGTALPCFRCCVCTQRGT